jgi:hypothetical protein
MKTISHLNLTKEQYQEIYNNYPHLKEKTLDCLIENADFWTKDKIRDLRPILNFYSCGYYTKSEYTLKNLHSFVPAISEYIDTYSISETLEKDFAALKILNDEYDEDVDEGEEFVTKCTDFFKKFWKVEILAEYEYIESLTDDQIFVEFYEHIDDILDGHFYIDGILLTEAAQ